MLTTRTQHIKDSLFAQPRQISMERATLFMESYKATEGEPPIGPPEAEEAESGAQTGEHDAI